MTWRNSSEKKEKHGGISTSLTAFDAHMTRSVEVTAKAQLRLLTWTQILSGASPKASMREEPIEGLKGSLSISPAPLNPLRRPRACPKKSSKSGTRLLSSCISKPGQREVASLEKAALPMSTRFKMARLYRCKPTATLKRHA